MLFAARNRKSTSKWFKPSKNVLSHRKTCPQCDCARSRWCVGSNSASRDQVPLSFHVATLSLLAGSLHLVPSNMRRQPCPGAREEGFPSTFSLKSKEPFTEVPQRRAPSHLTDLDFAACPSYTSRAKGVEPSEWRKWATLCLPGSCEDRHLSSHWPPDTSTKMATLSQEDEKVNKQHRVSTHSLFLTPMSNQSPPSFASFVLWAPCFARGLRLGCHNSAPQ